MDPRSERFFYKIDMTKSAIASPAPNDVIAEADRFYAAQNFVAAMPLYEKAAKNQPQNAHILYRLGICQNRLQRRAAALENIKKAAELMPDNADYLTDAATISWQAGDQASADLYFKKALDKDPENARMFNNYGAFLMQIKNYAEVERNFLKAIELKPDYTEAHSNLGLYYYQAKNLDAAFRKMKDALSHRPDWADGYYHLGNMLKELHRDKEAEEAYRKAVELNPNDANMNNDMGSILRYLRKNDEALPYFKKALEINPGHETALYNLMNYFEQTNKIDEAENLVNKYIASNPENPGFRLIKAKIERRKKNYEEALKIIADIEIQADQNATYLLYEAGMIYDRLNDPEKAFNCFREANALCDQSGEARYVGRNVFPDIIKKFRDDFAPEWCNTWSWAAPERSDYPTPVFLFGFPRSGTTMLDQVLSSHPAFTVAEEQPGIETVRTHLFDKFGNYTTCLAHMTAEDIEEARRVYYSAMPGFDPARKDTIFVDKHPLNTVMAGIMVRLFPDTKLILALRHPCDCVLSSYMQHFQVNYGMVHFLNLERAARLYALVMDTWEQYKNSLPQMKFHTLRYEDTVEDFRGQISSLLNFLDVPWDEGVMEFHQTARQRERIDTASYSQVTEKLYKTSKYRWERYRKQMDPVLEILRPYAEKLGYDM